MKFHIFSENISWPVLMNIQMSELMMSSPHNFLYISFTENDKNLIFQLWECKPCLISTQNKWEIMFILIYFDTRIWFYLYLEKKKMKIFKIFMCIYIYDKLWGDDITNSLIWIFIRIWSRNVFRKNVKFQNVTTSLFSYPIFIIF